MVFALSIALVGSVYFQYRSMQSITVYLPPDLHRGSTVSSNTPQPRDVYAFASMMYQYINTWSDGSRDYPDKIQAVRFYSSDRFRKQLTDDMNNLKYRNGINELRQRSRTVQPVIADDYQIDLTQVQRIAQGRWQVVLTYRLAEEVDGLPVKNALIQVPLYIAQSDADPNSNQWGLMITGFAGEIQRIQEPEDTHS